MRINMGDEVRDAITGIVGIVTGRTEWLNGCIRWCVQPKETKDGKPVEETWFDEQRLERVVATGFSRPPAEEARAGGPMPDPKF